MLHLRSSMRHASRRLPSIPSKTPTPTSTPLANSRRRLQSSAAPAPAASQHDGGVDITAPISASVLRRSGERLRRLEERKRLRRSLDVYDIPKFSDFIASKGEEQLQRRSVKTVQLNIGLYCNQSCDHCHVESSPQRTEMMSRRTAEQIIELLKRTPSVETVDITGGAPELNKEFRFLVEKVTEMGIGIIDRCNLTCLYEPGQEDLVDFLRDHKCQIVASLPCYSAKNVNQQRGTGVFDKSINALQDLNKAGFGVPGSGLTLDLVYNPQGPSLPPPQAPLEKDYKRVLFDEFSIQFNNLLCFTNMPIKRFCDYLYRRGELSDYMNLLHREFNAATVDGLMCKDLINISWQGDLFDCDFNQMVDMPVPIPPASPSISDPLQGPQGLSVFDLLSFDEVVNKDIATSSHCYGCTAGVGSS